MKQVNLIESLLHVQPEGLTVYSEDNLFIVSKAFENYKYEKVSVNYYVSQFDYETVHGSKQAIELLEAI